MRLEFNRPNTPAPSLAFCPFYFGWSLLASASPCRERNRLSGYYSNVFDYTQAKFGQEPCAVFRRTSNLPRFVDAVETRSNESFPPHFKDGKTPSLRLVCVTAIDEELIFGDTSFSSSSNSSEAKGFGGVHGSVDYVE